MWSRTAGIVIGVLSVALGVAGFAPETRVDGSGSVVSDPRPARGFSTIVFGAVGRLVVEQSNREQVTVRAEDNIVPLLTTEVRDNSLVIGMRPGAAFRATQPIEFLVEVIDLRALELKGSGHADLKRISTERVEILLRGSGNIAAAGRVNELHVDVSGSGNFLGAALPADRAVVVLRGAGTALVNARRGLDATLRGAGTIEYVGSPVVHKTVTGAGTIRKREAYRDRSM